MTELEQLMVKDAAEAGDVQEDQLQRVSEMARRLVELQEDILRKEDALKEAKTIERKLRDEELPELMQEIGLSSVTTQDGFQLTVKEDVAVSVAKSRQAEAYQLLRDLGFGDVIKNTVTTFFDKAEDDKAAELRAILESRNLDYEQKASVHAGTLRALVRDQLLNEGNLEFLTEDARRLLGIYQYHKVVVVQP